MRMMDTFLCLEIPTHLNATMKNQLRIKLGRLASIEFQRCLCVGGTKDDYVLPSEILDSAANTVQTTLASPVLSNQFNGLELASLREFLQVVNGTVSDIPFDSDSVSVKELVETNSAWNKVRLSAQKCLATLELRTSLEELLNRS
jgi:hypothetical protein